MRTSPLLASILSALALSGCGRKGEWTDATVCTVVADDATECPAADDVDEDSLATNYWCETDVRSVDGEGTLTPLYDSGGVEPYATACCYPATARDGDAGCAIGRPFVEEGEAKAATLAQGSPWGGAPGAARDAHKARAWGQIAVAEHSSIASFSRLTLDLMALGAPPSLVADALQAGLDEVEHARLASALASRFGGAPVGPGPMPFGQPVAPTTDRVALAVAAVREGCLGETVGAWLAAEQAATCADPQERAALERIAADESRHAALSWRLVAWLLREGGEPVRAAVAQAFAAPFAVSSPLGQVSEADCARVHAEVLQPAWAALMGGRQAA